MPADAYTQNRPRKVVQLVSEPSREERLPLQVAAITLKTEIVDDLLGIKGKM